MSLLRRLGEIVDQCTAEYQKNRLSASPLFSCREKVGNRDEPENMAALGDNLKFMKYLLRERELGGKVNLIYIDPPFFSKADYAAEIRIHSDKVKLPQMKQRAYHDTWENGMEEYLRMLTERLLFMRDLLADTGGIWVHLDWHVVHYVKIIMDEIFGEKNFINEVVWNYKSGGVSTKHFARKHDTLLYYAKSEAYFFRAQKEKSYNRGYKPYRFKGVKEYKDELGWYTMVNKKDVWQIDMVGRTSSERTGYATQKPELLIQQILESCTQEGDLCADFFAGSGTLAAVAEKMGRRWICCDAGALAASACKRRMEQKKASFSCYFPMDDIKLFMGKGMVRANVSVQESAVSHTVLFTVTLTGYEVSNFRELDVGEEQKKAIKKIMKEDPLCLVDYWAVDCRYDGEIFRPELFFYREKDKMTVRGSALLAGAADGSAATENGMGQRAAVKVYDVFGGGGFLTVDIPEASHVPRSLSEGRETMEDMALGVTVSTQEKM